MNSKAPQEHWLSYFLLELQPSAWQRLFLRVCLISYSEPRQGKNMPPSHRCLRLSTPLPRLEITSVLATELVSQATVPRTASKR